MHRTQQQPPIANFRKNTGFNYGYGPIGKAIFAAIGFCLPVCALYFSTKDQYHIENPSALKIDETAYEVQQIDVPNGYEFKGKYIEIKV